MRLISLILIILLLVSCGSTKRQPHSTVKAVRISNVPSSIGGKEVMFHSISLIGTPYRYGGSSRTGFDCSGMVQYVYKQALNVNLPRTAHDIASAGKKINKFNLKVGDLVFFNTSGRAYSHVGIYIGKNQFVHSPSSRGVIRIDRLTAKYWAKAFVDARTFFY